MRLIDKDKLKGALPQKIAYDRYGKGFNDCLDRVIETIDEFAEEDIKKTANYDHIKNMSSDEIADIMCGQCSICPFHPCGAIFMKECKEKIKQYLESEEKR